MTDREKEVGRLADRAKRTKASTENDTNAPDPIETEPAEETSPTEETESENTEQRHMRDRPAVFMYLPEAYTNDLDLACQRINLTYQQQTGEKLPKNRYLYPIVTKIGFETAADLDFEEIQELVDEIDDIDAEEAKADE